VKSQNQQVGYMVITTVLGEFEKALICGQRARPAVLQEAGFHITYCEMNSPLEEIVQG
jgi:NAD dependent epimerase/dehydratase family enzyme